MAGGAQFRPPLLTSPHPKDFTPTPGVTPVPSLLDRIERVPIDSLKPHPGNARKGNVPAIAESLRTNLQYQPLVAQTSTGFVLSGNHTLQAAQQLGWTEVDVVWVDVDDEHAHRILLSANRTSDLATYDDQLLLDLLTELPDLAGTGYSLDDLDDLRAALEEQPPDTPSAAPAGGGDSDRSLEGQTRQTRGLDDLAGDYTASNVRALVLAYPGARYVWVVDKLGELISQGIAESNADAVVAILENFVGETAPTNG